MPMKPKKPCSYPGCPNLTHNQFCSEHEKNGRDQRPSAAKRGYDRRWMVARQLFLNQNPLCMKCMAEGHFEPATVVDHIIPHRGDEDLFWDKTNWQALCKKCHDTKTMTKDRYKEYRY